MRAKVLDGTRQSGTITKISGTRLFQEISLPTVHEGQMRAGFIGHKQSWWIFPNHYWSFLSHFSLYFENVRITISFALIHVNIYLHLLLYAHCKYNSLSFMNFKYCLFSLSLFRSHLYIINYHSLLFMFVFNKNE